MTEEKQQKSEERIVRILGRDIEGKMTVYSGLAKIKGVSWSLSNAACNLLKIPKTKKIGTLTDLEIEKITKFLKNPSVPEYLFNRRRDFETGEDKHLLGSDLDLKKEFDIKRLKKIKSYRGSRHALGLPSRGQRTKGNFRRNRKKGSGIKKK
jgi:small subunit ribosomal protein S13